MKIPKNAKRVFKGVMFEVWQWAQAMFDGTTQTFEMVKRPDTVQILATQGDKLLITEEEQPFHKRGHGLFGGRVDEDEDILATAKRELMEEAGMESDDWELWKSYEPVIKMDWTIYFYIARNCRKVSEPKLESGEKIKLVEVSFEEMIDIFLKDTYWQGQLNADLLRMKLAGKLEDFKKLLFK